MNKRSFIAAAGAGVAGLFLPRASEAVSIPDDEPTFILEDGEQQWFDKHGKFHRDGDKPAVIRTNGTQKWYKHGKFHRDGKPAIVWADGDLWWFQHGEFHRDGDKPAIIRFQDGALCTQEWHQHDRLHRANDRPAVIYENGHKEWWYEGVFLSQISQRGEGRIYYE